jgi:hypothetical protein
MSASARIAAIAVLAGCATAGPVAVADESLAERAGPAERELREPRVTSERAWVQPGAAAPLDASGRAYRDMAGVSVRWWARHGRADVGLGLGTVGFVAPPTPDGTGVGGLREAVPAVTVGMRYRVSSEAAVYADATSARSLATDAAPGLYNTKVGMEWQPAKSKFGLEGRSLGVQLQSGYRMSLRLRSKGIGVYFKGKF